MLVLSTVIFALLSFHQVIPAPISILQAVELELRSEGIPTSADSLIQPHIRPSGRIHERDVDVERRQVLDAVRLGYTIATNPTVDAWVAKGAKVAAKEAPVVAHKLASAVHKLAAKVKH